MWLARILAHYNCKHCTRNVRWPDAWRRTLFPGIEVGNMRNWINMRHDKITTHQRWTANRRWSMANENVSASAEWNATRQEWYTFCELVTIDQYPSIGSAAEWKREILFRLVSIGLRPLVIIANQFDKLAIYCIPKCSTQLNWIEWCRFRFRFASTRSSHSLYVREEKNTVSSCPPFVCDFVIVICFRGSHLLNRPTAGPQQWKQKQHGPTHTHYTLRSH